MLKSKLIFIFFVLAGCDNPAPKQVSLVRDSFNAPTTFQSGARYSSGARNCLQVLKASPPDRCAVIAPAQSCSDGLKALYAAAVSSGSGPARFLDLEKQFGDFYLNHGPASQSAQSYQAAHDLAVSLGSDEADSLLRLKAIAQLRSGEVANCLEHHNEETCVVPLTPKARHIDQRGSRGAIDTLLQLLKRNGGDAQLRWLLNLAYMTVGEYPSGVPVDYRIPVTAFASKQAFPKFKNIAPALGLDFQSLAGGVIVDDFNNDGYLDLILSSIGNCDSIRLLINNQGHGFDDRTAGSGLDAQFGASHMIQADYDNDGFLDFYATRGIWERPGREEVEYGLPVFNSLMRNLGNGRFEDVTEKVGLRVGPNYNIASVWADFDNDGFVDLAVCNAYQKPQMFLNREGRRFEEPSHETGLTNEGQCMGAAAADVNNDGTVDLFLAIHGGGNLLFLNEGKAHFKRSTSKLFEKPDKAFSTWFSDYDNDGWVDLFVAAWNVNSPQVVGQLMTGQAHGSEPVAVFRNNGRGEFVILEAGLKDSILVMGANFGDFDNDGFEDLLLGTGGPPFEFLLPNRAFRNNAAKGFVDVTFAGGFGNLQKGHGIGFADIDNDGDQEIVASFGGWFPADRFAVSVYENPGFGNNWVTLQLQGSRSNRSAIGSRLKIEIEENGQLREIHRIIGSGASFGSGSLQAEIGLGKAVRIKRIVIRWAGSQTETVFENLDVNRIYRMTEGTFFDRTLRVFSPKRGLETLKLPAMRLGTQGATHHHSHEAL